MRYGLKMKKQAANIITVCRIFGSILLLFFSVFSIPFYILYLFCGVTDMVDGTIARKTNTASEFGAKLDSVADMIFFIVSFIKILPVMDLPKWMWIWVIGITCVKIGNIVRGVISKKKLIAVHTIMNKLTGFFLFLLPLTMHFVELKYSAELICAVATVAAVQEFYLVRQREFL